MPIPVNDLKRARKPLPQRIVEFLAADPANAYSIDEIYVAVEGYDDDGARFHMMILNMSGKRSEHFGPYVKALKDLVAKGAIEGAQVRGTEYFSIGKP